MTLLDLANNVNKINIEKIIEEALKDTKDEIIKLNTEDQLLKKGIGEDGKKLKRIDKPYPIYSPKYEKKKRGAGKYTGHIDLNYFGQFHKDGFNFYQKGKDFFITANDVMINNFNLSAGFREWYPGFEGLTDENKAKAGQILIPVILEKIKHEMGI